ncbi:ATP-binding protein [Actinoplanes siamensis]|uniref:histidine kinase n=1 Tax=Actinoplanes siamensis TaxID=1223317 RepID=A0A919MWS6_9ACTN|nr:ATP-binding protein [Actinoplanes siamensis]GIF02802.1 hypothetical protein Asi03nite_03400 [Actinoplanes siamensis]
MSQTHPPRLWCGEDVLRDPRTVLAAVSEAYLAVDASGRVLAWNPAAQSTFGYSLEQACGRMIQDLIVPARSLAQLAGFFAGRDAAVLRQRVQSWLRHRDGHEFPAELTVTVTDEASGTVFHAFVHDVTVTHRASRFSAVDGAVSRGLAEAESSAVAAQHVVEALGELMGWPVTELWLADDDRRLLACAGRHLRDARRLDRFTVDEIEFGLWLPGRVYQQSEPLWIPDLAADSASARSRLAARAGLHVAVGIPISAGGHTLGALCVYGDRIEDPEDTLVALLGTVAARVGQYLDRRRAEELAVELARTKDEFLALVTHELRNPLAVITGTAALFDEDLGTLTVEDQRTYLKTIINSAQRLSVIADDLLDLARLESGHLAIDITDTDLSAIVVAAVRAIEPQAAAKNITMHVRQPGRLPMYADAHRLRQVADNLLSNAVKYTPAGGTVTITVEVDEDGWITWTFADTGIGIPEADRPRMFRRFYRASTALDQRIPGTGLGLVITRTILERHGGTIDLARHAGPGTTFRLRLPVKPAPGSAGH